MYTQFPTRSIRSCSAKKKKKKKKITKERKKKNNVGQAVIALPILGYRHISRYKVSVEIVANNESRAKWNFISFLVLYRSSIRPLATLTRSTQGRTISSRARKHSLQIIWRNSIHIHLHRGEASLVGPGISLVRSCIGISLVKTRGEGKISKGNALSHLLSRDGGWGGDGKMINRKGTR